MRAIAESAGHLSAKSQAIHAIVDTVKDLAERSNLLAIDAAIEAAKAGEQGKGAAVVAQEVRHFATQSKQTTEQVRTLLTDIQQAAHSAVLVTKQGTQAVHAGLHEALKAGESIQILSTQAQEVARTMTQIDASSQHQLVGMDQAAQAMLSIKTSSQRDSRRKVLDNQGFILFCCHEVGIDLRPSRHQG
jgi:methyl-accepting chemotaxis protein